MAFDSFTEFLAMGGHGFYVWLSYGLTFMVLAGLAWHALGSHKRERRALIEQALRNRASQQTAPSDEKNDNRGERE